jgi:hypothetical protein
MSIIDQGFFSTRVLLGIIAGAALAILLSL